MVSTNTAAILFSAESLDALEDMVVKFRQKLRENALQHATEEGRSLVTEGDIQEACLWVANAEWLYTLTPR